MRRLLAPALATLLTISACGTLPERPAFTPGGPTAQTAGIPSINPLKLLRRSAEQPFHDADLNHDGRLSAAEADLPADLYRKLDTDRDGSLSLAEMVPEDLIRGYLPVVTAFFRQLFDKADQDHDGQLSPKERREDEILASMTSDLRMGRQERGEWDYDTLVGQLSQAMLSTPDPLAAPSKAIAGRTPTLVVQGYLEPSYYFMYGIYRHLKKQGWPTYGINLFPNITRAEVQAAKVDAKIQQILKETGASKINLVCHSFGGLISRFIIQKKGGFRYVDRYVSIATPHSGTAWCYLGAMGGACIDMRIGSEFLKDLNKQTIWPPVRYSAIWTKGDEVAVPPKNCILPGATNYPPVPWTEHLLVLWSPVTYGYVDQSLQ